MIRYWYSAFLLAIIVHLTATENGPCKDKPFRIVHVKCQTITMEIQCRFYKGCCPNSRWDPVTEACVACSTGYFWNNCSKACPYPTYGDRCLHKCSCDRESCDFMSGCVLTNVTEYQYKDETNSLKARATSVNWDSILFKVIMAALATFGFILLAYFTVVLYDKCSNPTSSPIQEPMYHTV